MSAINELAAAYVGNWKKFESFMWHGSHDIKDKDSWTIIHTNHRDSEPKEVKRAMRMESSIAKFTVGGQPRRQDRALFALGCRVGERRLCARI